ncbi:MAG: glycosyltransferase family 25 protein [Hyphomonadaceae bacterium]|nr:glycosyltransferase family 25 protein [Hyphomonadaceae bacterium]
MQITTIVINLDRDATRMAHMRRQLDGLGMLFSRFAAIDGAAMPKDLQLYFASPSAFLSPGEIGCYASHLILCDRIVRGEIEAPVLVLEDDVELSAKLPFLLRRLIAELPADWDMVRLSRPSKRAEMRVARLDAVHDLVRYTHVPTSTGAYLISRQGAEKFLAPRTRTLPIDQDLRRVWAWRLNMFGVTPTPVRADVLEQSSINLSGVAHASAIARRHASMRRQRLLESASRVRRGVRDFGARRWFMAEVLNLAARLTPRRSRQALLAWTRAQLAGG